MATSYSDLYEGNGANKILDDHEFEAALKGGIQSKDENSKEKLIGVKVLILFIMFAECYIGLLPRACGMCMKNQYPLSFLNCFSAGIFLAMSLLHVLPEAAETYDGWAKC